MAQNNTYRQQTSTGLGSETACPQCGTPPPTYLSYEVKYCDSNVTAYVHSSDAFFASNPVINSNTYSPTQVVMVTTGANAARACAEIIDVDVNQEPTLYIDIKYGPFSTCNQCFAP